MINHKAAKLAKILRLDDRMKIHTTTECYQTIKDHKEEFMSNMPCRVIQPAKPEIQRVSKIILDEINSTIRTTKNVNQWRNTAAVIDWFTNLENKETMRFFKFDIQAFYPSITQKLLQKAIVFAANITFISENDINIIMQSRETLLFHEGEAWKKKKGNFDVPMGAYDGAEVCELIGLYILDKITKGKFPIFPAGNVGLYRDDGLAVIKTRGRAGGLLDDIRKKVHQAFLDEELEITCEKGMTSTDFLDVRLNLETNEYRPYRKPNDHPVYIDARSNHPPNVIKQIPQMIEKRLTNLSSNERVFDEEKAIYVKALKDSGYKSTLKYNPEHKKTPKTKRTRNRNPIYYNPPWSENVKTNIGKNFLHLVETHFNKETKYKEAHILSKIFDRSKVKVSYCTMNNMKKHISKHNVKICQKPDNSNVTNVAKCNCRVKDECPLNGECLTTSVVYQASVRCDNSNVEKTYV